MPSQAGPDLSALIFVVFLGLAVYLLMCIRILQEYERGVIFRLGRLIARAKGPGVILVFKPIDSMVRVSLRTVALDVPPQDIITRDNVSVHVNAVVYFQVVDPAKAIVAVEDYLFATSQMAQTTLRSVLGQQEMDDLLTEREKLNLELQTILDRQTEPWGVKVNTVEIKKVDLPQEMQRAMARQAEAERERRAKIIGAEGEFQSAEKLVMAADMMGQHPMAMQMRYLQTLVEISAEKSSTIIFPVPMEMLRVFGGLKETEVRPRGPEPEPTMAAKVEPIPPRT
jgi:regulator of protease activity HflC (stomatin/prohibitin superfamily)